MVPPRLSLKQTLLTSVFLSFSLLSALGMAQVQDAGSSASSSGSTSAKTTTAKATTTGKTITNTNTNTASTSATSTAAMPTITGTGAATTNTGLLTGLPTLTGTTSQGIPTYPAPSVPPTQNAPFMNQSTLPDGTVFIAVGAILGAFGLTLVVWRGIVACLLHRSVERANAAQHAANDKATFAAPPASFYRYTDRDSSAALAGAASGVGKRRTNRGPIPSATPSQTNLFFSPTAPGGVGQSGNRESRFLPSGFYASASPASGHAHGTSVSLAPLRPQSVGHATALGPSPPDSPAARATQMPRDFSSSSINLNRPPSGRAPSAYLEDLLDEQGGQFYSGQYPPSHPHPHHHTHSQSSLGRYS